VGYVTFNREKKNLRRRLTCNGLFFKLSRADKYFHGKFAQTRKTFRVNFNGGNKHKRFQAVPLA
jgi:hypothetical protein